MTTSTIVSLLAGNTAVALAIALVAWGAGRVGRPALAHAAWLLVLVKLLTPPLWQVPVMDAPTVPAPHPIAVDEPHRPAAPVATLSAVVNAPPAIEQAVPLPDVEPLHVVGSQTAPPAAWSPWHVVLAAWMIGAASMTVVAAGRLMRFRGLLRRAQPLMNRSAGRSKHWPR